MEIEKIVGICIMVAVIVYLFIKLRGIYTPGMFNDKG